LGIFTRIIHKYQLHENSFLIIWLAKYLFQEKIEVFWGICKRNNVKFYYQRSEKSDENQGKLRKVGLYKTFRKILQKRK
jgi:hypothetical protein